MSPGDGGERLLPGRRLSRRRNPRARRFVTRARRIGASSFTTRTSGSLLIQVLAVGGDRQRQHHRGAATRGVLRWRTRTPTDSAKPRATANPRPIPGDGVARSMGRPAAGTACKTCCALTGGDAGAAVDDADDDRPGHHAGVDALRGSPSGDQVTAFAIRSASTRSMRTGSAAHSRQRLGDLDDEHTRPDPVAEAGDGGGQRARPRRCRQGCALHRASGDAAHVEEVGDEGGEPVGLLVDRLGGTPGPRPAARWRSSAEQASSSTPDDCQPGSPGRG